MIIFLSVFFVFFTLRNYKRFLFSHVPANKNYCLLIAHPDDESMFFAPTLLNLKSKIHILCLSKGDTLFKWDYTRENELKSLCLDYNWDLTMYNLFDNEDWDIQVITNVLTYNCLINPFYILITFDQCGVSGHKNHKSCYEAAKKFSQEFPIETMYLKSQNIFQKYFCNYLLGEREFILGFKDYFSVMKMMTYHRSQLLWFRYLYLIFSSYTSYNSY
ncbi:N-acetlyglucosaminylphosphatidylinositol deacetlyase (PIGL) [Vairimorpha necatrix]|uniref:N-acetylglucosaminylphosphatidylinositol deacetylase n=1 Tax=Vairimorpha necatrix TaxID=6039 RepID=A0AAX4JB28_9MICR